MNNRVYIASDHAGFELKEEIMKVNKDSLFDLGTKNKDRVDYPDFAQTLVENIKKDRESKGILICGTGNGINMSANKHSQIRAALCWNPHIAEQARLHNNANVLTMPARHLEWNEVKEIIDVFLSSEFEGGRHQRRVNKI